MRKPTVTVGTPSRTAGSVQWRSAVGSHPYGEGSSETLRTRLDVVLEELESDERSPTEEKSIFSDRQVRQGRQAGRHPERAIKKSAPLKVDFVPLALNDHVRLELDVPVRSSSLRGCETLRRYAGRGRQDAVDFAADDGPDAAEIGLDDAAPLHVRVRDLESFGGVGGGRIGSCAVGFEGIAVVRR